MLNVTKQQARNRYVNILPSLQDAIFSVQTGEIVEAVCEQNNIPAEKVSDIARSVGYVFLGFIHPEDLAKEISDRSSLSLPMGKTVADALAARLFAPLKDDINKSYAPAPLENEVAIAPFMVSGVEPPKPLEDVKRPEPALSAPPRFTPPAPPAPPRPPIVPPMPGSFSASIPKPPSAPFGNIAKPPAPPSPTTPFDTKLPMPTSGFGKMPASWAPPSPKAAEGAAPKILQEEVEFKPLRQPSGFGINIPLPKSLDAEKEKIPMRPAVLEFGNSSTSPQTTKQNPSTSAEQNKAPRVVHYSEYRTPLTSPEQSPPTSSGQISQQDASTKMGPGQSATAKSQTLGRDVQEITALPSTAPAPLPTYGSTARPFDAASFGATQDGQGKPSTPLGNTIPRPVVPPPSPLPTNPPTAPKPFSVPPSPPKPPMPAPKMSGFDRLTTSDVLLNEKELPPGKI